ncbi:class I SAM-dependent methyltransferase [Actinoplanes sp. NPDC051411]|uniref:class I SAM-dependent methyltransferase n=1 Tax=Actinoplanes sp. NPDC051411 TaxID=3155522 RepID=UPI0034170C06
MSTESESATWSGIAGWYDELLQAGSGPHQLAAETTVRLSPAVHGSDVLDVACGQGIASRALARAGARSVTGADLAPEMIEAARRHEANDPLGIVYLVEDAATLRTLPDAAFDLVTCQLGLMDIPDLTAALTAVHRVLRPGGSFVFVLAHPCFLAPGAQTVRTAEGRPGRLITDYLGERFWRSPKPQGVRRAGNHHRTLATYLNALPACGFTLELIEEPPAGALLARQQPVYSAIPIFFAARARR